MTAKEFKKVIDECNTITSEATMEDTLNTITTLYLDKKLTTAQHKKANETLLAKWEEIKKGQNTMENTPIETVKGEIVEISEKDVNAAIKRVQNKINSIEKGYISIIGDVAKLKAADAHKTRNFKNFYIMCQELFGMSRGTVHNLLSIYERFGNGNWELVDEAKEMSVRQMLEVIKNENNPKIEGMTESDGEGESEETATANVSRETLATLEITTANLDEVLDAIKSALGAGEADGELTFKITITK